MMSLPGKLTIGFLQEDNPVKAFFRFKPAYTLEEDGIKPVENPVACYPEDGGIRIVPDKNELSTYKGRMKALGRYCALDLRKFPGDNEKIRPNKNFGAGSERNASIVYSDVITGISSDTVMPVLDATYVFVGDEITLRADKPSSDLLLVLRDGKISGPWQWTNAEDVVGCLLLKHARGKSFISVDESALAERIIKIECDDGISVDLLVNPLEFNVDAPEAVEEPKAAEVPAEAVENAQAPASDGEKAAEEAAPPKLLSAPAEESAVVEQAPQSDAKPEAELAKTPETPAEIPSEIPAEQAPVPVKAEAQVERAEPIQPQSAPPARDFKQAPQTEQEKPIAPAKPWLQRAEFGKLRAIVGRMDSQTGINPRKGRSLAEVVDEQWRKSRFEQLGHPVPSLAKTSPVISPIDRAVNAAREAWEIEDARKSLVEALVSDESMAEALEKRLKLKVDIESGVADERAIDMESERLRLMTEIDALRAKRTSMKAELMEDLRRAHRDEFAKYEEKNDALKAELQRNEAAAKSAQIAAEAAQELLGKTSEQMEQHMLNHLMTQKAIELVMHMADKRDLPAQHPVLYEPTAGELISDLRVQLDSAGFCLDNDDAVNLLAAMTTGGMMIVSGPSGCGKSQLVRQLAAALGLSGRARRFVEAHSPDDEQARELLKACDGLTPCILMLDDINLEECSGAINDAIRLQEEALAKQLPLYIILTVQDAPDGTALSSRLLGRAFFIRLDAASTSSSWKPPKLLSASPDRAVSLSAIRDILSPCQELETEVEQRLHRLREQLDGIGYTIDRRTLNELWYFCASVASAVRLPGISVLDRAVSQRALPAMLASMEESQLVELPRIFCDMPRCMKLMEQPLPLPPL